MLKLSNSEIKMKLDFIHQYIEADNAASGSKLDSNANVNCKNIATMEAELNKDINIQVNRAMIKAKISEMFGEELGEQYIKDLESHIIYTHDETSLKPYCVSVDMYPLLTDGMVGLGGSSKPPKNLESFCGIFVNFVFAIASQFAGAVATTQFLTFMENFIAREWGDNWYEDDKLEEVIKPIIEQKFQQVVYSINQPAAARGFQSVFWNISLFDKEYFNAIMGNLLFDNYRMACWEGVDKLQRMFLDWFGREREVAELTFPVVTAALLTEKGKVKDEQTLDYIAGDFSNGNSVFVYLSDTPDSLASCCRLRNEVDGNDFSFSLGAGGVKTGSINVITINLNRVVQTFGYEAIPTLVQRIHHYHLAFRAIVEDYIDKGMLPVYTLGYIDIDKQFCTIGINGLCEAAEYLGYKVGNNEEYINFSKDLLSTIGKVNKLSSKEFGVKFNTEMVPAENLGVKNAKWDMADGLVVNRDCYNSYFYLVEDEECNIFDKIMLHGEEMVESLDGGSALHINLDAPLPKDKYVGLINVAATAGCNYLTVNVPHTPCDKCGHIEKRPTAYCTKCNSVTPDRITRVIGYAKRVSAWSRDRKDEFKRRVHH